VLAQSIVRRHRVKKQVATMLASQFIDTQTRLLGLWDTHFTPKLHRSVFLHVYNSVTIFNLFILLEEEKQFSSTPGSSSSTQLPDKQYREEQKALYDLLRDYAPEGGINQLYIKWGVDSTGKKRKQHFCDKLFAHPTNVEECKDSAELLCRVIGILPQCEELSRKKMTRKEFNDFIAVNHQKMLATAHNKRSCVLL